MQIIVVGRIQVRKWETKEGENRYSTEIIAEEVEFADSKKEDKEEWKPADKQCKPEDITHDQIVKAIKSKKEALMKIKEAENGKIQ